MTNFPSYKKTKSSISHLVLVCKIYLIYDNMGVDLVLEYAWRTRFSA